MFGTIYTTGQILQVREDMQSAYKFALQRKYVINFVTYRAILVELSNKICFGPCGNTKSSETSIGLRFSFNSRSMPFVITSLDFIATRSIFFAICTSSIHVLLRVLLVIFASIFRGAYNTSARHISFGNVTALASLAREITLQTLSLSVLARDYIHKISRM